MKIILILFGLLNIFIGALPFIKGFIPQIEFIPTEGMAYNGIIVGIGVIALILGWKSQPKKE